MTIQLEKNIKYFVTLNVPNSFGGPSRKCGVYYLRIKVLNIKPGPFTDYITFETLESSKETLSECKYNPITVPANWIIHAETLHTILDKLLIDDVIYMINTYV